jgi:hypothetical protein
MILATVVPNQAANNTKPTYSLLINNVDLGTNYLFRHIIFIPFEIFVTIFWT